MAIPKMHHVLIAIPVGGEETARRFYGELLGLTEVPKQADMRHRGGLWFRTGNIDLHLGIDPDFQPADKAHVAWHVDDLDGLRERLTAAGYQTSDDIPLDGYRRFQRSIRQPGRAAVSGFVNGRPLYPDHLTGRRSDRTISWCESTSTRPQAD